MNRLPAKRENGWATPAARARCHHSWGRNLRFLLQCRPAFRGRFSPCGFRYNAWPLRHRRLPSRSCPARRSTHSAMKNPAPCAQWCHTRRCRRGGGIYRSRRPRYGRIFYRRCSSCFSARASRRARGGARASNHRAHQAARGLQSRSWRNRDSCGAFRLQG